MGAPTLLALPRLDHVALHVADRDAFADLLVDLLDVSVLERTARFTLLGAHPDHGKLTLLDAVDDRLPASTRIVSLVLAESPGADTRSPIVLEGDLVITFVGVDELGPAWAGTPRHALVGVTLRCVDPPLAAAALEAIHGMHVEVVTPDHAMLDIGELDAHGRLTLTREDWRADDRAAMLDHVGVRVDDALDSRLRFEQEGLDVVRWVDAPHSRAVFVEGPDQLLLEFVELTQPFAAR